jgi:plastocyanin
MKPGINMTLGAVLFLIAFGISAPVLYGAAQLVKTEDAADGGAGGGGGGGGATGGPATVNIVAQNLVFDLKTITVSAGVEVTVNLDNRDAGVPHNISFYTNRSASSAIFKGALITGPSTITEKFNSPSSPGNYFFRCDVHPDTMTGTFSVQ